MTPESPAVTYLRVSTDRQEFRTVQTRMGYAELAVGEAIRTAKTWQEEAIGLRQALDVAEAALAQVRVELAASERARMELEQRRDTIRHPSQKTGERDGTATRRKVGRPCGLTNRVHSQG